MTMYPKFFQITIVEIRGTATCSSIWMLTGVRPRRLNSWPTSPNCGSIMSRKMMLTTAIEGRTGKEEGRTEEPPERPYELRLDEPCHDEAAEAQERHREQPDRQRVPERPAERLVVNIWV